MNMFPGIFENKKGFTLIEVMIVVAIIGILAAIAIPNFISFREKGYCTQAESDAANIKASLAAYFSDPQRTALPSVNDLILKEKLSLNNKPADIILTNALNLEGSISIEINDSSHRCPYGSKYMSYMGSGIGAWQP